MGVLTSIAELIAKGFPEEVAQRIASGELPMDEASRQARKADFNGEEFYKGMYPYDWTKESGEFKGPVISEINRTTPFPSFGGSDGDVDIAGFMSKDPDVASRFAGPSGAVFPLLKKSNSEHVIDASGANAGDVQFGEAGKPFRDAIRSGEYDSIQIKNTADEGDVHVALDPSMIRSPIAAFDPQYKGSNIMGGALAAGVGLGALSQSEDADAGFVTKGGKTLLEAFHGSPHKFDKFSMDKIGTGEGAQAYGHGLYFADSEDVAKGYRDNLKDWDSVFEMNNQLAELQSEIDGASGAKLKKLVSEYEQVAEARELAMNDPGALYRTEIGVTPESLLDWDKPLSEQSEAVREIARQLNPELSSNEMQWVPNHGNMTHWSAMADSLEEIPSLEKVISKLDPYHQGRFAPYGDEMMSRMTGEQFYNSLASPTEWSKQVQGLNRGMVNGADASGLLSDRGIKGIKYLDGDSRAVGDGTSNYVIFDDSLINIAERGKATVPGLAATAAGGGALATIAANLQSIVPESTMGALYGMGLVDSAIGAGDTAVRAGQDVINEVALGGTMLKNAIADTDSQPWELDIDPETEQGNTMVGALTEDLGRLLNYGGAFGNMPSGMDMIQGGVDAYKKYVQPHLSDRVEEGLGGAGILAASLMGVKKVPTRTVGEEIRTDVYDPSQVAKGGIETPYSQNPVLANIDLDGPRPDNIAAGQWKRRQAQMDDPVIRAREEARPEGGLAVGTDNLEAGLLSYEDLARENTPLTWLPADGTMVGEVRQVGGRQIKPVAVNGGPLHADKYNSWMSMNGAAYTKQKHAQNILSETGESPMYMHLNMGNEGSNFSHMPSEIWTNYVDQYPMHGAGWDALNKRMSSLPDKGDTKGVSADWAKSGVDSPEGLRNFLLPQYGAEAANSTLGNRRKIFMDTVAKAGVQDAGGPIVNDIYSGLIEPGLLGKQGMAGYRGMLSVDTPPAGLLAEPNRHPSYNTVIPGNGVFTFKEGIVPADVMFPDAFNAAHRADKLPHQRFRSVQTNGTEYQIADQQWLDGIMGYLYSQNQ